VSFLAYRAISQLFRRYDPAVAYPSTRATRGATRPRWGDDSWAVYLPSTGRIYFADNYIQYRNCTGSAFTLTVPTCGGTRDDLANWGTSVNSITP
jgi:hypothetical protein